MKKMKQFYNFLKKKRFNSWRWHKRGLDKGRFVLLSYTSKLKYINQLDLKRYISNNWEFVNTFLIKRYQWKIICWYI